MLLHQPGLGCLVRQGESHHRSHSRPWPDVLHLHLPYTEGAVGQVDMLSLTRAFGILVAHVATVQILQTRLVVIGPEGSTTTMYYVSSGSRPVEADCLIPAVTAEDNVMLHVSDCSRGRDLNPHGGDRDLGGGPEVRRGAAHTSGTVSYPCRRAAPAWPPLIKDQKLEEKQK